MSTKYYAAECSTSGHDWAVFYHSPNFGPRLVAYAENETTARMWADIWTILKVPPCRLVPLMKGYSDEM